MHCCGRALLLCCMPSATAPHWTWNWKCVQASLVQINQTKLFFVSKVLWALTSPRSKAHASETNAFRFYLRMEKCFLNFHYIQFCMICSADSADSYKIKYCGSLKKSFCKWTMLQLLRQPIMFSFWIKSTSLFYCAECHWIRDVFGALVLALVKVT